MLEKNPKTVRIVSKNFPLPRHNFAKPAAKAAFAADRQGKFEELSSLLYDNYSALSEEKIVELATSLNLDMEKFNKDRNDPLFEQLMNRDMAEGQRAGVRGIPTIYIEGVLLQDRSPEGFQNLINSSLARKKKE